MWTKAKTVQGRKNTVVLQMEFSWMQIQFNEHIEKFYFKILSVLLLLLLYISKLEVTTELLWNCRV